MQRAIDTAIRGRRELVIDYNGWRRIQPHVRGISLARNPVLRAYQLAGPSVSGHLPMWRLFRLDRVRGVRETRRQFHPRADYHRNDRGMRRRTVRI
jgi:hypothetical protein